MLNLGRQSRTVCLGTFLVAVLAVLAAGCRGGGDFSDIAGGNGSTSSRPQLSVTTGPGSTGSTGLPGTSTPATTGGPGSTNVTPTSLGGPGLPPSTPPSQPVVTGARTDATASGLTANPACAEGRALVKLSWKPVGSAEQAVAVSARPDGLDSGNYTTSETLPASRTTYELRESQPGGIYYWRVLTRSGSSWLASETAQFEGPVCTSF